MANEPNTTTSTAEAPKSKSGMTIETAVVYDDSSTVLDEGTASTKDGTATELDLGDDLREGEPEDGEESPEGGEGAEEEAASEEAPDADALPDYDPENEEVHAAYSAKYEKDGGLNMEALSKDYWESFNKSGGDITKSGLPDGVYEYLKATAGVSKDYVKQIEKSLVVTHQQEQAADISRVASVEDFNKAIEWARADTGYTPEQRTRFNAAFDQGGDDRADAIEALMARYERSKAGGATSRGGFGQRRFGGADGERRPSSPRRDVTGSAGAGSGQSGDVFKTRAEHQQAWSTALTAEKVAKDAGDRAAIKAAREQIDAIRKKARRSRFK